MEPPCPPPQRQPAWAQDPAAHSALFARLSASRPRQPLCAFAGGPLPHTLLAACGHTLLDCLSSAAVLPLRAACREARSAVARHPYEEPLTCLPGGSFPAWRACFPAARVVNLLRASAAAVAAARRQHPHLRVLALLQDCRVVGGCEWGGAPGALLGGQLLARSSGEAAAGAAGGGVQGGLHVWHAPERASEPAAAAAVLPCPASCCLPLLQLPGQRLLVAGGRRHSGAAVWSTAQGGAQVCALQGAGRVLCAAALAWGGQLAAGCADATIGLWCSDSGRALGVLEGHCGPVVALALLSCGQRLASASGGGYDTALRLWHLPTRTCLARVWQEEAWEGTRLVGLQGGVHA